MIHILLIYVALVSGALSCNEKETITPKNEVPAEYAVWTAKWHITSSDAASGESDWTSANRFYATSGAGSGKAYISTFSGGDAGPVRVKNGSNIAAASLAEGDGFEFVYPSVTVAAGSSVDFHATLYATTADSPKYWIFEYLDGDEWKSVEGSLRSAVEDVSLKYSFYVKYFSSAQYTTVHETFTLENSINGGDLRMRCRAVGKYSNGGSVLSPAATAYVEFVNHLWDGCNICIYQGSAVKDTKRILILGNSFTYCYSTSEMFKEISRSQGHDVDLHAFMKGGQSFGNHLALEMSQEQIKAGGFDYAILQDQSGQHALYFSNPAANASVITNTSKLVGQIRSFSPFVQPILENTWSFPGSASYEGYGTDDKFTEALQGGALLVADSLDMWLSPICEAFRRAKALGITDLYHTDNKHPNRNGAYLKACVNYLLIYGENFDSNVPDCLVEANTAATLRSVAEEVVLQSKEKYRNPDASGVTPGGGNIIVPGGGEIDSDSLVDGENGIRTADQLISFAYRFNNGDDISSYKNSAGEVALLADIDLQGREWTPVGTSTGVSLSYTTIPVPSYPFKDVFNGAGHTIKNVKLTVTDNTTNVKGFFGATSGATVKNVKFDNISMDYTATGISSNHISIGGVVGYALDTEISNVEATVDFSGKVTSSSSLNVNIGGIVGMVAASSAHGSKLQDCAVSGKICNDVGEKYSNSYSSSIGGIAALAPNKSGGTVLIKNCTNNAVLDVKTHRAAGIIGVGFYCQVEDCINNGDITANYSSSKASNTAVEGTRTGGIMGYFAHTATNVSYIKGCRNNGRICTTEPGSAIGGVVGLMRCLVLEDCSNYGDVVGPAPSGSGPYRGLLIGGITSATNQSTIKNCSLKGRIGAAMDGGDAVSATADNYLSLGVTIASGVSCNSWTSSNVSFIAD